jgi:uncharacterized protein (TIGR02001 family)
VIARADRSARRARARRRASSLGPAGFRAAAAAFCICTAAPATAEVGTAVSIFSDARFRGYSLSSEHPVGILDLSYDEPSGVYAGASASVVASSAEGLRPLGLQLNGGYAKRLSTDIALDAGITHSAYARYSSRGRANSYTEAYAGVRYKFLTSRVYFSPHYFEAGTWTAYGELNGSFGVTRKLSLDGHAGLLVPVRNREPRELRPQYDWQFGLTRRFGPVSVRAAWTGAQHVRRYERANAHDSSALVFGLVCPL